MALVSCSECAKKVSAEASVCPGCGHPVPPTQEAVAEAKRKQSSAGLTLLVLLAVCFGFLWYCCNSVKESTKALDAKSCHEWLSYYETFCKSYPEKCTEGPRKLAKCDP